MLDIYARLHVTRIRSFDGIDLMAIVHTCYTGLIPVQGKKAILFEKRTRVCEGRKRKKKKRKKIGKKKKKLNGCI